MKIRLILILLLCTLQFSCYNRFNCDSSDNVKLGETDFSDNFKEWEIEEQDSVLNFVGKNSTFTLNKRPNKVKYKRLNKYGICRQINIESHYQAFAYYEYENKDVVFISFKDSIVVGIKPYIEYDEDKFSEEIYI